MKISKIIIGILFSVFLINSALAAQPLNKVVAIVNDGIITQNELNNAIEGVKARYAQAHQTPPPAAKLRSQILDQLIAQKIEMQMATRAGIKATDAEVKAAIGRIATANHLSVSQLKSKVISSGGNYAEFFDNIRQQLILSKLQQQLVMQETKVSDADINAAMREIKQKMRAAAQIQVLDVVVPISNQQQIPAIKSALAKNISNSEISKQFPSVNFNDMGWQNANTLPEIFVKALVNAKVHQVVGPINAPNGLHLLKVTDMRSGPTQNITRDQAKMYVLQQKSDAVLKKWVDKLRKTAYIKIMNSNNG